MFTPEEVIEISSIVCGTVFTGTHQFFLKSNKIMDITKINVDIPDGFESSSKVENGVLTVSLKPKEQKPAKKEWQLEKDKTYFYI
jgi:hypothetical protein